MILRGHVRNTLFHFCQLWAVKGKFSSTWGELNSSHVFLFSDAFSTLSKIICFFSSKPVPLILPNMVSFLVLRLLTVFNTNQVCHVWCTFKPGYPCRTNVIFGTLTDGSLEINSLANKMVFKNRFFVKKLQISCSLDRTILFKFH